eukprot:14927368-Heterocapsa_arctica.AAC.1
MGPTADRLRGLYFPGTSVVYDGRWLKPMTAPPTTTMAALLWYYYTRAVRDDRWYYYPRSSPAATSLVVVSRSTIGFRKSVDDR